MLIFQILNLYPLFKIGIMIIRNRPSSSKFLSIKKLDVNLIRDTQHVKSLLLLGPRMVVWGIRRQVRSMRHGNVHAKMELLEQLVTRTRLIDFGDNIESSVFRMFDITVASMIWSIVVKNACDDGTQQCDPTGTSRIDFHRFRKKNPLSNSIIDV